MKRIIQCVYTKMEGNSYEFGYVADADKQIMTITSTFDDRGRPKAYSFFTDDDDLKPGDLVIVQSHGPSNRLGMAICQVSSVEGLTKHQRDLAENWVIQKIDLNVHVARLKRAAVEQEIRNKLRARKEEAEELLIYKALAKDDSEIAKLLARLAEFDPTAKNLLPKETKES